MPVNVSFSVGFSLVQQVHFSLFQDFFPPRSYPPPSRFFKREIPPLSSSRPFFSRLKKIIYKSSHLSSPFPTSRLINAPLFLSIFHTIYSLQVSGNLLLCSRDWINNNFISSRKILLFISQRNTKVSFIGSKNFANSLFRGSKRSIFDSTKFFFVSSRRRDRRWMDR